MIPALYLIRAAGPVLVTGGFVAGLLLLGTATGAIEPLAIVEDLLRSLIGV